MPLARPCTAPKVLTSRADLLTQSQRQRGRHSRRCRHAGGRQTPEPAQHPRCSCLIKTDLLAQSQRQRGRHSRRRRRAGGRHWPDPAQHPRCSNVTRADLLAQRQRGRCSSSVDVQVADSGPTVHSTQGAQTWQELTFSRRQSQRRCGTVAAPTCTAAGPTPASYETVRRRTWKRKRPALFGRRGPTSS